MLLNSLQSFSSYGTLIIASGRKLSLLMNVGAYLHFEGQIRTVFSQPPTFPHTGLCEHDHSLINLTGKVWNSLQSISPTLFDTHTFKSRVSEYLDLQFGNATFFPLIIGSYTGLAFSFHR